MEALSAATTAPVSPPALALKLMSDERLARWAANGSQAAFAVIFERHHQALHRYCQSIVGNGHDAADALQNTMLKALRALPGETRTIALKPWLYRIAHNESISLLRARRGDSNLDAAAQLGGSAADTIAESRERLRDLTRDLGELTEQQRGTLLMRELGGLEFEEISAALQISATAAKQSVYEGRCSLQFLQEGRAMNCDVVRRVLSDGDRRTLRNMKLRGHLRACAGCRQFEAALRDRPAQLAGLAPPLPLAAAASILHGLLGVGTGTGTGGGLLAAVALSAKSSSALSLGAAKVASVVVIAGGAAGGAAYVAPDGPASLAANPHVSRQSPSATPAVAPAAGGDRGSDRPSRRSASITGTPESSPASPGADSPTAAPPVQRPSADSAPAPVGAARPSVPAAGAGAAPQRGAAVPVDASERGARPPASSTAAPAAAADAPPARAASGAAPVPTTQTAAAPMISAPATARQAPQADVADGVVPVVAPQPR